MLAVRSAFSKFFSPRDFGKQCVHTHTGTCTYCDQKCLQWKAMETAVRAFSESMATKTLSTMLYNACTSMEIIIGRDMFSTSLPMGMVPILFSAMGADVLFLIHISSIL